MTALATGFDLYGGIALLACSVGALTWGYVKSRRDGTPNPFNPWEDGS